INKAPRRSNAPSSPLGSAESDRESQPCLARLFVLAVHVSRGFGQGHHGFVEINAVSRRDLIAGDHISSPGLYRAECASFDTRNLKVAAEWVACHSEVMFESRFRGVLDH